MRFNGINIDELIESIRKERKENDMKPFDREKALAGEPVITRDGKEVIELHYFPAIKKIVGYSRYDNDNMILAWNENGIWDVDRTPSIYDLLMKSETSTYYMNIYKDETFNITKIPRTGSLFNSYDAAVSVIEIESEIFKRSQNKTLTYIKTISFDI